MHHEQIQEAVAGDNIGFSVRGVSKDQPLAKYEAQTDAILLKEGADVILREVYGANADTSGEKLLEN